MIIVEVLESPTLNTSKVFCSSEKPLDPSWMDPIIDYKERKVPKDRKETHRVQQRAQRYVLFEGGLLRKKLTKICDYRPFLRCLGEDEANYSLHEIHEGICSTHSGGENHGIQVPPTRLLLTGHDEGLKQLCQEV